jgi:hypothetical protein
MVQKLRDMRRSYDKTAHILYVSFGQPRPAKSVSLPLGVLLRADAETGELVGVTFIDFKEERRNEYERILKESSRIPAEILPEVLAQL